MPDRATRSTRGWREIHRYAYVQRPYEDVWFWLAGYLRTIGAPLPGGGRSVELRVRPGGVDLHRPVRLHLAGLVCDTGRASVGLSWVDAAHPHLFPELDGVLELTPVPNEARPFTQLGVVARYRPPFGPLGAVGDRLVGAEGADAALTAFIDEVAQTAEAHLPHHRRSGRASRRRGGGRRRSRRHPRRRHRHPGSLGRHRRCRLRPRPMPARPARPGRGGPRGGRGGGVVVSPRGAALA